MRGRRVRLGRRAWLAAALVACAGGDGAGGEPASEGPPALQPVPGDTLFFVMREVRFEEGCRAGAGTGDSADVELAPCVTVELRFPDSVRAAVPALADAVRGFVRRTAFTVLDDSVRAPDGETAAAAFLRAYDAAYRANPAPTELWSLERESAVVCNTPRLVGLRTVTSQHTGGAHPSTWTEQASYDARTGRLLDAAALFVPESLPALTAAAERAFRRARAVPAGQPLADAGFTEFPQGRFALPADLLACPDSVAFRFDAYDVGPYALGPTEFALPLVAVRAFLRPEGPLAAR